MRKTLFFVSCVMLTGFITLPVFAKTKPKSKQVSVTSQKALIKALKNKKLKKIALKGKKSFTIPKGSDQVLFTLSKGSVLQTLKIKTAKLKLKIDKGAVINSLDIVKMKNGKIDVKGQVVSIYLNNKTSLKLTSIGKTSFIGSIYLQKPSTLIFNSKTKKSSGIYVLEKSNINLTGKKAGKISIFIKDSAEESTVKTSTNIKLYTGVRLYLTLNKGSENSTITTLDYKTPITVTNNTSDEITVFTPSLEKIVEANSVHTVTGK